MKNVRKERKLKVKSLKRLSKTGRSADTLADTTKDILRQCRSQFKCASLGATAPQTLFPFYRTNPKANVHMSGKKRRSLLKEAKRLAAEKSRMGTYGRLYSETSEEMQPDSLQQPN